MSGGPPTPIDDEITVRRALVTKWSATGKRLGYSLVLLAMIAFGIGFATNFGDVIVAVVVGSLALSAVALVPAIIFGYGVKAAEREERGEPSRH